MGKVRRNRGRWPNAADWASHDAVLARPPMPVSLHIAVNRIMGSTLVEISASSDDTSRAAVHIGRIHVPGALLDLPTHHHILAALGDELHGIARTMSGMTR